jgi:XTP/dITP diphosphohydrolase
MITLLIATRNRHKSEEISAILGPQFGYLTLQDLPPTPVVHEDASTFAGNATKKATELAKWLAASPKALHVSRITHHASFLVLADDSGLEVDALNGAPGVHSARFAALDSGQPGNSSDAENCAKLLRLLKDVPLEKRSARFRCVLALTPVVWTEPQGASPVCYADEAELQTELFEGSCEGCVTFAPRGRNGFGYDPLFIPLGYEQTFAELSDSAKNQLSHRARALAMLKRRLEKSAGARESG